MPTGVVQFGLLRVAAKFVVEVIIIHVMIHQIFFAEQDWSLMHHMIEYSSAKTVICLCLKFNSR